jgi:hypothetical protein
METPDNIKYGNMTAEYRMKYKQILEKTNAQKNKNKNKNKKKESAIERISRILYGGNK